jgi:hypothetical protein
MLYLPVFKSWWKGSPHERKLRERNQVPKPTRYSKLTAVLIALMAPLSILETTKYKGSGLEISLFVYCFSRYHLADRRIMNLQIIGNLFQSKQKWGMGRTKTTI